MSKKKQVSRARRKSQFAELRNKTKKNARKTKFIGNEAKELEKHPFYQNVIRYGLIPLWEENRKAKREDQELVLDEELKYHLYVFQYASALYEAFKRLYDIPFFIHQNPKMRLLENRYVSAQEWFVYHYANYRVIATGIFDTALLVVNDVLELGFEPSKCRKKQVLAHEKVIESRVAPLLIKLDELIEKHRQERHWYVHRSERPDLEFVDNLNAYRFLKEAKEKGFYKGELPKQTLAHMYFFEQRDKKSAELRAETTKIYQVLIELLNVLNIIYMEVTNSFMGQEEIDS